MSTSCEALHPYQHCRCTLELGHAGDHRHAGTNDSWPRLSDRLELANKDAELDALQACVRNLDGLEQEAIERIISYLQTRFLNGTKGGNRS